MAEAVERSRQTRAAELAVREDSRLAAAAVEELDRTRAQAVLVELEGLARFTC